MILHGVNISVKVQGQTGLDAGFSQDDIDLLLASGFNTVRLTINWASVEPEPFVIDHAYIDEQLVIHRMLADAGIYVLVDMHQDQWGPKYGGFGHPAWANIDEGLPPVPDLGFPLNYFFMPALWRAFDNFWANETPPASTFGLQDHYAAMWQAVAARFASEPYLLGYDLMNEPAPGTLWEPCISRVGCQQQDETLLGPFHEKVRQAIRQVDTQSTIWYEPWGSFAFTSPTHHPKLEDDNIGFSFHDYCLIGGASPFGDGAANSPYCESTDDASLANAVAHYEDVGGNLALMMTEFGATTNSAEIARIANQADNYLMSWQYWFYCWQCQAFEEVGAMQTATDTPAIVLDMRLPMDERNVDQDKLDALVRPYPQAIAGTPQSYSFDRDTHVFTLRYSTERVDGAGVFPSDAVTEIFVPAWHYPEGFIVTTEGAEVLFSENPQKLMLGNVTASEVSLTIEPK